MGQVKVLGAAQQRESQVEQEIMRVAERAKKTWRSARVTFEEDLRLVGAVHALNFYGGKLVEAEWTHGLWKTAQEALEDDRSPATVLEQARATVLGVLTDRARSAELITMGALDSERRAAILALGQIEQWTADLPASAKMDQAIRSEACPGRSGS